MTTAPKSMPRIAEAAKFSRWVLRSSDHARVATCTYDENLSPQDWQESYVRIGDRDELAALIRLSKTRNVFVCSSAFDDGHKFSHSKTVWVDIDSPRLKNKTVDHSRLQEHLEWLGTQEKVFRRLGALVVASGSEGGRHIRVRVNRDLSKDELEKINTLMMRRFRGDSKQAFNSLLRLPGTINHKTQPGVEIEVLRWGSKSWDVDELVKFLGNGQSLADMPSTPSSSASNSDGEAFDLNKRKHAGIRETVKDWNDRFESDPDMSRYAAGKAIVMETAKAGLTVDNAVWAARQCKPLVDKEETERGYRIHIDIPKVWDKEGADKYAVRANRHLQPVPDPSSPDGKPLEPFASIDWANAFQQDFSKPDWLPGMILERGQQMALAAEGKAGKSLVVLDWCTSMVLGRPFLGHSTGEKLTVLYFDRENSLAEIITRLRCLGITEKDLPDLQKGFIYKQFPQFNGTLDDPSADAVDQFLEIVADVKPDIVILDTASRFIKGKENDSDTWLQLYQLIHAPLKRDKIASVRIDHFGKDSDKGARGSSAKSQDVDHVWELTKEHEGEEKSPEGKWIVTRLKMKRTHTRTGHGDDVMSVTRKGRKTGEKTWAEGCTSHRITGSADLIEEAAVEADAYTIILTRMRANVGQSYTVKEGVEILTEAGSSSASESTANRVFRQMMTDPVMKKRVSKGKRGRAAAWTYYG